MYRNSISIEKLDTITNSIKSSPVCGICKLWTGQNLTASYGTRRLINNNIHKISHVFSILSQFGLLHNLTYYVFKVDFNAGLSS